MSESANNFNKRNRNITPQLDCVLDCLCCISIKGSNIYKGILKATDSKKWLLFYMALKYLWKVNILKKKKKVKKNNCCTKANSSVVFCLYVYRIYIGNSLRWKPESWEYLGSRELHKVLLLTKASWQPHGTFTNTPYAFITHSCDTCREGRFQNKSSLKNEKHALKIWLCFPHLGFPARSPGLEWNWLVCSHFWGPDFNVLDIVHNLPFIEKHLCPGKWRR